MFRERAHVHGPGGEDVEELVETGEERASAEDDPQGEPGYASYQLIRSVLAAYASDCSFCVLHDERRPDLREEWFNVIAAVKSASIRVRLKILTWQELAEFLPADLQAFLDVKYGIASPGKTPSPIEDLAAVNRADS